MVLWEKIQVMINPPAAGRKKCQVMPLVRELLEDELVLVFFFAMYPVWGQKYISVKIVFCKYIVDK